MPALLERPKLSNAMARALHKHIMRERERKRQGVCVCFFLKTALQWTKLTVTQSQRTLNSAAQLQNMPQHLFIALQKMHSGSAEHGQFSGGQGVHEPYGVAQAQHPSTYAPGPSVPVSFASSSQIRGASAFQAMQYLPHQQPGYPVHSHFTSQPGYIPGAGIPLQKQLEHANQHLSEVQRTCSSNLHVCTNSLFTIHCLYCHHVFLIMRCTAFTEKKPLQKCFSRLLPQLSCRHVAPCFHLQAPFQSSPQGAPRHSFLPHSQSGQRFYHHGK
uniref:G protein pathway suppressor 2 n=1 Tax=Seriola lalandi dorsalis TaxID=1841481 RepID=A0A3B4XAG8_SERLL